MAILHKHVFAWDQIFIQCSFRPTTTDGTNTSMRVPPPPCVALVKVLKLRDFLENKLLTSDAYLWSTCKCYGVQAWGGGYALYNQSWLGQSKLWEVWVIDYYGDSSPHHHHHWSTCLPMSHTLCSLDERIKNG